MSSSRFKSELKFAIWILKIVEKNLITSKDIIYEIKHKLNSKIRALGL
jgi:hypothetical protein